MGKGVYGLLLVIGALALTAMILCIVILARPSSPASPPPPPTPPGSTPSTSPGSTPTPTPVPSPPAPIPPIVVDSTICTFPTSDYVTFNESCADVPLTCDNYLYDYPAANLTCGANICFDEFFTNIFFFNQGYPDQITNDDISRGIISRLSDSNVTLFEMVTKFVTDNNITVSGAGPILGETIFFADLFWNDTFETPLKALASQLPAATVNYVASNLALETPAWTDIVFVPTRCPVLLDIAWLETNNVTIRSVYSFAVNILATINPTGNYIDPTSNWFTACLDHTSGQLDEMTYICGLFGSDRYYSYASIGDDEAVPNPYNDFARLLAIANDAANYCGEVDECFGWEEPEAKKKK
jgi:hypothetical protein